MRPALFLVPLLAAAASLPVASPAAAQSCATLGGQLDCGSAPIRKEAKPAQPQPAGQEAGAHGQAEVTVSNRGVSSSLDTRSIDSHGLVEFSFRGSNRAPCRIPPYGSCE